MMVVLGYLVVTFVFFKFISKYNILMKYSLSFPKGESPRLMACMISCYGRIAGVATTVFGLSGNLTLILLLLSSSKPPLQPVIALETKKAAGPGGKVVMVVHESRLQQKEEWDLHLSPFPLS